MRALTSNPFLIPLPFNRLFDEDRKPCNPLIPNKATLLNYLCERIPHTELRKHYNTQVAAMKEKQAEEAAIKAKEDAKAKAEATKKKQKSKKKK